MMTHTDAFLRDIVANPADDAPRLIFADWLEENGQPERAGFIRVQIELDKIRLQQDEFMKADVSNFDYSRAVVNRRQDELRRRERKLSISCPEWVNLPPLDSPWFIDYRGPYLVGLPPRALFHRGFVEHITLSAADWLTHGAALVRAAPLTNVRLTDREPFISWTGSGTFGWFQGDIDPSAHHIPERIYDLLAGRKATWTNHEYTYPDTAHADLSQACLIWARAQPQ